MLESLIIQPAFAQDTPAKAPSQITLGRFVPLILIFGVFYLLIIRPQNKKLKEHQEMVNNLKIGTKVITSSGIIGVVKEIDNKENQVEVEISQGVIVKMLRNSVSQLVENKIDNKAENKADKKVEKKSKKWLK